MLRFARKDIPALPVHDSFVVPVDNATECFYVMLDSFKKRFGQNVSTDGSFHQSVVDAMKRDHVLDRSPEWDRIESDVTFAIKADDDLVG
jgi:hypothetical protein